MIALKYICPPWRRVEAKAFIRRSFLPPPFVGPEILLGITPDHLFEPPVQVMKRFIESHGFDVVSHYTYSRSDEISRKPFNRLYRRALLQGSNARFYARRRGGS